MFSFFFFNDTAPTEIDTYGHTLSLHDALPISFPLLPMADLFRSRGTLATRAADLQQPVPDHSGARIPFHQPATAMCPDPLANRAHVDGEDGEPASPAFGQRMAPGLRTGRQYRGNVRADRGNTQIGRAHV